MAANPFSDSHESQVIWHRVYPNLLQHAVPDSRFHYDFSNFIPDFRGSSSATDRVAELPCYQSAKTVLITPDNSLESLRCRALKDGKKVLVATYHLRRGFVLLDPRRIDEDQFKMASLLDGMERVGIGRHVTLSQIQEECIKVDLCIRGVLVASRQGIAIGPRTPQDFGVQWAMLLDREVLDKKAPVVAVAHSCQVVQVEEEVLDKAKSDVWHVAPDFVITPEKVVEVEAAGRPAVGIVFDRLDPELLRRVPPLQELKGIHIMEQMMKSAGFAQEKPESSYSVPSADEEVGISMVERIMKGYKP